MGDAQGRVRAGGAPRHPRLERSGQRRVGAQGAHVAGILADRIEQGEKALRQLRGQLIAHCPGFSRDSRRRDHRHRHDRGGHVQDAAHHHQDLLMTRRKLRPKIGRP